MISDLISNFSILEKETITSIEEFTILKDSKITVKDYSEGFDLIRSNKDNNPTIDYRILTKIVPGFLNVYIDEKFVINFFCDCASYGNLIYKVRKNPEFYESSLMSDIEKEEIIKKIKDKTKYINIVFNSFYKNHYNNDMSLIDRIKNV